MSNLKYFFLCILIINCVCYNVTSICDKIKNERILPKQIGEEFNSHFKQQYSDNSGLIFISLLIMVVIVIYVKNIGLNDFGDWYVVLITLCIIGCILTYEKKPFEEITTFANKRIQFNQFMSHRQHIYIDIVEIDDYKIHGKFIYQHTFNYPAHEIIIFKNDTIIFEGVINCHQKCLII